MVGLDIEPSYIAAAQVRVNGALTIERAASSPLRPGVVRDGEVTEPELLTEALSEFFATHKLDKKVRLGVASQRIVVRTLDMPPLASRKELEAAVRFQAQDHIPMPLDQTVLDFHSLGMVDTPQGERARVVVVAARRDMVERLLTAARNAGLKPEGIDLSAFAMIRALRPDAGDTAAVLYVNAGGLTNLAVAQGGVCLFTRVVSSGMEGMVANLAERRGLTLEHARQWLTHTGLEAPLETLEGDPAIIGEARTVLEAGIRLVADEVRTSLDFYRAQPGAEPVERAVLTGPAVEIDGFGVQLSNQLGIPVECAVVAEAVPGALGGVSAGRMTVAAGLAVGERA